MKRIGVCISFLTLMLSFVGQAGAVLYTFEGTWDRMGGNGLFFEELKPTAHFSGWIEYTWPGDEPLGPYLELQDFSYFIQVSDALSISGFQPVLIDYIDDYTFRIIDMVPVLSPSSPLFLDETYLFLSSADPLHRPLPMDFSSIIGGQLLLDFSARGYSPFRDYYWGGMDGTITSFSVAPSAAPVPEPATMLLVGLGLCAMAGIRRLIVHR